MRTRLDWMSCNSTTGSRISDVNPGPWLFGLAGAFWALVVAGIQQLNKASVTEKITEFFTCRVRYEWVSAAALDRSIGVSPDRSACFHGLQEVISPQVDDHA